MKEISKYEMLKHSLRQVVYRWFQFKHSPVYEVFEALYNYSIEPFPWIVKNPLQKGFLLTNFICPEFQCYRGREIAFFDSRHVGVSWLPGASHTAGGYVENGTYQVILAGYGLRLPLQVEVVKNDQETLIRSVKNAPVVHEPALKGGLIAYAVIVKELECLIAVWLKHFKKKVLQYPDLKTDAHFKILLNKIMDLNNPLFQEEVSALL